MFTDECKTGEFLGSFNNPKILAWYLAVMRWKLFLTAMVCEFSILSIKDSCRNCDWTARWRYFSIFIGFGTWNMDQLRVFVFQAGSKVYTHKLFLDPSNVGIIVGTYHLKFTQNFISCVSSQNIGFAHRRKGESESREFVLSAYFEVDGRFIWPPTRPDLTQCHFNGWVVCTNQETGVAIIKIVSSTGNRG